MTNIRFTLKQLQVFLATAHTGTITRAAEQLSLSQSAASTALQDLEQRYNTVLFERIGKRLKLSARGSALLPQVENLMDQIQQVEAVLRDESPVARLKVGATMTIGNYLALDIAAEFRRRHESADFSLHVANTQRITEDLLNFELDIGLIEGEVSHPDLNVIEWQKDELVIFCAPTHPLARQQHITERNILDSAWVLRESGSGTRQAFDRAMQGLLPKLNIYMELEHTEAIKRAVASDFGLGCLSRIALHDEFARGQLIPLKCEGRDMSRLLYFVLHAHKSTGRAVESWIDCCRQPLFTT